MANVESIWPAASEAEAGRQAAQANGAAPQLTPAEPRLTDLRSRIALVEDSTEAAAMLPHWEHFLKGRFQRDTRDPHLSVL